MSKKSRKVFMIDTSVLLYDKNSIHSFPENDVVLPIVVLDELDRKKEAPGLLGESARYVNRFLDELRERGNLEKGVELENGQTVRVALTGFDSVPEGLSKDVADNKIISCAFHIKNQEFEKDLVVVTKDINFRVKCDSLGIKSEDYYKDKVVERQDEMYRGYVDITVDDPGLIDRLYAGDDLGSLAIEIEENLGRTLHENEFFCIKCNSSSYMGIFQDDTIKKVLQDKELKDGSLNINAKNREQLFALNVLNNDDIPLVSITGLAGSGKTFITLMSAISGLNRGKYERIIITRNIQPVGKDIGFLPGDLNDKMLPWISPIVDNFRHAFKDKDLTYFEMMRNKGTIEIAPLSFMRGRTFNDTFLIMDEAQNASIHEIKTVITRMGENSKIVLLGDVDQIDTPYIDSLSNGLTIVAEKFKDEKVAAHIQLKRGERSYLSSVAAKII
tara:strand:- start:1388 stop:2719 length:1332 start_codon:yes stop_codon:yes gene_type:complete